jgi:hypothetical protein
LNDRKTDFVITTILLQTKSQLKKERDVTLPYAESTTALTSGRIGRITGTTRVSLPMTIPALPTQLQVGPEAAKAKYTSQRK